MDPLPGLASHWEANARLSLPDDLEGIDRDPLRRNHCEVATVMDPLPGPASRWEANARLSLPDDLGGIDRDPLRWHHCEDAAVMDTLPHCRTTLEAFKGSRGE